MTRASKPEHVQKSATSTKSANRTIMDDAPLFAGLDDFVLPQAVKKPAESPPTGKSKEKKKAVKRPSQQVKAAVPPPRPVPKAHKTGTTESSSVLLSVTEICALLKISRATLVRMDKSGKLPGRIKLGGSVRFHRETIETWLQSLITPHPTP